MRNLVKNSILPLAAVLFLTWIGQYIFIVDGQIDWLRFCLVYGIPFGIPYMIFVIPIGGSVSGNVLLLVLNAIVGALFGCLIAGISLVRAVIYLLAFGVEKIIK